MTPESYVRGVVWGFPGVKEWRCGKNSHEQTGPWVTWNPTPLLASKKGTY